MLLLQSDRLTGTKLIIAYSDASQSWRNSSRKGSHCPDCLFRDVVLLLVFVKRAIGDHVWLEKTSLQEHLVVCQSLEDCAQHFLCYPLTLVG